jgi:hypothetical protein
MRAFPTQDAWAFSVDAEFTGKSVSGLKGFIRFRKEIADLRPQRVVLGGGGVGFFPSIRDMLHWMDDALRLGAECHVYNIGVARMKDFGWATAAEVQRVLQGLKSLSVRDDVSWFCMREWPGNLRPEITHYPEKNLPCDEALAGLVPSHKKVIGVSVTGQAAMRTALEQNVEKVAEKLDEYAGAVVVPIISTVSASDPEEDDVAGFNAFRKLLLDRFPVEREEFLDKAWWRANMTPLRLKGIIGKLDVLFTQRKHNLIHAIGTQTPVVGIYPTSDDSIARIFYSLRGVIPPRSSQVALRV